MGVKGQPAPAPAWRDVSAREEQSSRLDYRLDISEGFKMGLDHACGGVCACSTCHVVVHQGLESCNEATDAELDELDEAPGITPKSRLGCQTVPDGTTDIIVEIPDWNKNYAKEADH